MDERINYVTGECNKGETTSLMKLQVIIGGLRKSLAEREQERTLAISEAARLGERLAAIEKAVEPIESSRDKAVKGFMRPLPLDVIVGIHVAAIDCLIKAVKGENS